MFGPEAPYERDGDVKDVDNRHRLRRHFPLLWRGRLIDCAGYRKCPFAGLNQAAGVGHLKCERSGIIPAAEG